MGDAGLSRFGKAGVIVLLLAETAAAAVAIRYFFWSLSVYDPIYRVLYHRPVPASGTILAVTAAILLLILLPLRSGGTAGLHRSAKEWFPLIGAGALLLFPVNSTPIVLLAAILLIAWGFYRHGAGVAELPSSAPRFHLSSRGGLFFSLLLAVAGCLWGFYMQKRACDTLFLYYSDWGIYAEHYLKLAFSGSATLHDWLVAGGHWNGAMNLLMTAALRLAPAPETVFLMNSAMIYSAVPLVYLLGRQLKLPPGAAAAFSVLFFFTPVVSNQPLSLFYGFHPINLLPSCFLLFFLFRERKRNVAAAVIALLTLCIQETATIFWFGYALVLAAERKYLRAVLLGGAMVLLFYCLSHWVIPGAGTASGENYNQMFHYSQLGNTPLEVVLSPILKPGAFWRTLLALNNLEFVLFLSLPFLFFLRSSPKLLLAGVPLLAGVCLQSSRDLQNTVLQYGVELNCLVVTAAIFGAGRLFAARGKRQLFGAFTAVLFGVFALYLLTGRSAFLGKYPFSIIAERPESGEVIDYLKSALPPGATVHATQRLRAQLLFDHPTRAPEEPAEPEAYYLLEAQPGAESERIHETLLKDPAIVPVTSANWYGYEFVVFRKLSSPVAPPALPFLFEMTQEEYEKSGIPLKFDSETFSVRLQMSERALRFLFRLEQKAEGTFRFLIRLAVGENQFVRSVTFANGLRAVSLVEPGTVFLVEIPISTNAGQLAVDIREERR